MLRVLNLPTAEPYSFLFSVATLKKESVTPETLELVQPYLSASDFTVESARKIAGSLAGLVDWALYITSSSRPAEDAAEEWVADPATRHSLLGGGRFVQRRRARSERFDSHGKKVGSPGTQPSRPRSTLSIDT